MKKERIQRVSRHFATYEEFAEFTTKYFRIRNELDRSNQLYEPSSMRKQLLIATNQLGIITQVYNRTRGNLEKTLRLAKKQNWNCKKRKPRPNYEEYIVSDEWYTLREKILQTIKTCVLCNNPPNHLHHRTYNNLGNETIHKDVIPLCKFCHKLFHSKHEYDSQDGVFRRTGQEWSRKTKSKARPQKRKRKRRLSAQQREWLSQKKIAENKRNMNKGRVVSNN